MEVSQTTETKKFLIYETESHVFRIGDESLNQILDGKESSKKLYETISKRMSKQSGIAIDSGFQRDQSRDLIFRHIKTDEEPPYKLKDTQMVLSTLEEKKDAPNQAAMKEGKKAKA